MRAYAAPSRSAVSEASFRRTSVANRSNRLVVVSPTTKAAAPTATVATVTKASTSRSESRMFMRRPAGSRRL